jgi:transposase
MNRCQHGYMNGYSENLRRKVLSAVGRGMPKAQAARTFDVSLPSLRRYVDKAERGEPLAPKKSPGSPPKLDEKTRKLLEESSSTSAGRIPLIGTDLRLRAKRKASAPYGAS